MKEKKSCQERIISLKTSFSWRKIEIERGRWRGRGRDQLVLAKENLVVYEHANVLSIL